MGVRDALMAGARELRKPMPTAVRMQASATVGWNGGMGGSSDAAGLLPTPVVSMVDNRNPMVPPTSEMAQASPRIIPRIVPGVKPRVLSTPTSRTRSRTDIAMVLAETSRMVNMTAAEMAMRNA